MKAALEILGYPTWHWIEMAQNPPDMAMWADALEAKFNPNSGIKPFGRAEFDNLLGHWGACTDRPACVFAEELVAAYPDAKVVLVERDPDRWYKSYSEGVIDSSDNPFIPLATLFDRSFLGGQALINDILCKYCFKVSQPRETWLVNNKEHFRTYRANAKATYLAHNEMVKRVTPSERLLVFDLADGWEPLCKHLGKPVPDVPFPRVNETTALQEKIQMYIAESFRRSLTKFAQRTLPVLVAGVGVVSWWTWYR